MDYLSTVRVLDTDYKIKDEEAARINHTHKVEEIGGAAKEGHRHRASEITGLSTVATSGKYADLTGAPSSMKNPAALTVQANGKTVATYDGSSAAKANITPANIGAAPSSHTHDSIVMLAGRPATANHASRADKRVNVMMSTSSMKEGKPGGDGYIISFNWDDDWYATQVFVPNNASCPLEYRIRVPSGNSLSWSEWMEIYSEKNAHKASVGSAAKLSTARTISLKGAVTGNAKFDGSGDVTISTTAKAPKFEYDSATGNLYYVTEE